MKRIGLTSSYLFPFGLPKKVAPFIIISYTKTAHTQTYPSQIIYENTQRTKSFSLCNQPTHANSQTFAAISNIQSPLSLTNLNALSNSCYYFCSSFCTREKMGGINIISYTKGAHTQTNTRKFIGKTLRDITFFHRTESEPNRPSSMQHMLEHSLSPHNH
jgi:hypothetical protein